MQLSPEQEIFIDDFKQVVKDESIQSIVKATGMALRRLRTRVLSERIDVDHQITKIQEIIDLCHKFK